MCALTAGVKNWAGGGGDRLFGWGGPTPTLRQNQDGGRSACMRSGGGVGDWGGGAWGR